MAEFDLSLLLKSAGERMASDLREKLVSHPGELGAEREEIIRRFLTAYLPKRFEISTGFAFDCAGRVSKQLDIIIADGGLSPRFETSGGRRYYPCEAVVGVGQVRSAVTSRRELIDAFDNLESAKALDRSANGRAYDRGHGEAIDHIGNHLHQIFTFLLITGKALAGETVREALFDHVQTREVHLWPNVILALDRFLVTFCCDTGVCPNPMDARGVALKYADTEPGLLLRFYLLLGGAIEVIRTSGLPYWEYLQSANQWDAEVLHWIFKNPPPLLRSMTKDSISRRAEDDD